MTVWSIERGSEFGGEHTIHIYATEELAQYAQMEFEEEETDKEVYYNIIEWQVNTK